MNRSDLQALAQLRLDDAKALWDQRRFHGCYYLAGYAVECALKACIAKTYVAGDFPDKDKVDRSWKHNLVALLIVAGLDRDLENDARAEKEIGDNWSVAKSWAETSRYDLFIDETKARDFLKSVADSPNGVLAWLQRYW
jgi:hypothetical protein